MTDRELLRIVERSPGQRAGYKQLVRELSLPGGRERRLLVEHLARLTAAGRLVKLDRDHWAMPSAVATRDNLVAGRLDLHRDGYGFVRPETQQSSRQAGARVGEDIFIPPNEINSAMQGDQVLVELMHSRGDGRKLGRIARVLTRKNRRDFRGLPIVTIDGETARDFDDAVLVRPQFPAASPNCRFTSPTSRTTSPPAAHLDAEARLRGTSVLFP
jgi:exoribonuclease R